ncbi:hypothetical protein RUM43_003388 [Polyplax serrata]|uniref:Uncharacterized protein n=1 Tax=Polyplax serrata TaxID=468196 RepID=A0AAN8S9D8_POLSC
MEAFSRMLRKKNTLKCCTHAWLHKSKPNSTTPTSPWLKLQQTTEYHHEPRGYHRTIKGVSSSHVLVHITGKMAADTAILMLDKHMDVANVFVLFAWPKSPLSGVHVDRREMATSRV